MSLYNLLFGANPAGPAILATLGLTPSDVGRYRDCYVENDRGHYRIVVHTRNGGGNRDEYQDVLDELAQHPLWLYDQDDDFDCTYADIRFNLPEDYATELRALADKQEFIAPSEKWQSLFASAESDR
jgi:hypothetical protein